MPVSLKTDVLKKPHQAPLPVMLLFHEQSVSIDAEESGKGDPV